MPPSAELQQRSTLPLNSAGASIERVGGKGQALATLAAAGLPVPDGFLICTGVYRDFIAANDLQRPILDLAQAASPRLAGSCENAAEKIRARVQAAAIPAQAAAAIALAYAQLDAGAAVAVRSSATAEDLPGLSFAGQQDSFLNVRGEHELLAAVRLCWASLWTARAISYRARMRIDHDAIAMGVVVQVMINAEVAGVLFTANPATGNRAEILVNASFGLGEAIVSGQVTPDSYLLNRDDLTIKHTQLGSKQEMTVPAGQQGTRTEPIAASKRAQSSLSPARLTELAALGLQAETLFGGQPQDLEWAVASDRCWLLQSRPITHLPAPLPNDVVWEAPHARAKLLRRQVVENMPEPLSPLFEELYLREGLDLGMDQFVSIMGLPFNLDQFVARPLFVTVNGYGYCRYEPKFTWRGLSVIPRVLYWYAFSMPKFLKNLHALWQEQGLPAYLASVEQCRSIDCASAPDEQLLSGVRALARADACYWFYITFMVGAAKITDAMLQWFLASRAVKTRLTSGMFLSGFPSKTRQAQDELRGIAAKISATDLLRNLVLSQDPHDLLATLNHSPPASAVAAELDRHLATYGHQVYNLDFVQPTQAEDPLPVLLSLQSLVGQAETAASESQRLAEMTRERERLVTETAASLGPARRWLFGKLLNWAQKFGPFREEALFYMGAGWPTLRRLALELGRRLVEAGTLSSADEVFYLYSEELAEASAARTQQRACPHLTLEAAQRKSLREARKRLHPPARVPADLRFKFGPFDFTRFFEVWETQQHNASDAQTLQGSAVSPGRVTAPATVILSPADFAAMQSGTILVCATTTPAWTPLLAQAGGLVTDIGGILAHGSIVAREYGIPAVLGTGNATQRIVSGQMICVDGNAGTVTIVA